MERKAQRHDSYAGLLPAHPIRAAVGRVLLHPILHQPPERHSIFSVSIGHIRSREHISHRESRRLPNELDVAGLFAIIRDLRPMDTPRSTLASEWVLVPLRRKSSLDCCVEKISPLPREVHLSL